jgi:hypothetical protein
MRRVGVTSVGAAFETFEYAFDGIPISVGDMLRSEVWVITDGLQWRGVINRKHGVFGFVFLSDGRSGWDELSVERPIRRGINSGVQL